MVRLTHQRLQSATQRYRDSQLVWDVKQLTPLVEQILQARGKLDHQVQTGQAESSQVMVDDLLHNETTVSHCGAELMS